MSNKREELLEAARGFTTAVSQKRSLEDTIKCFSSSKSISIFEHGLPQLAPFFGRNFQGQAGVGEFFGLLAKTLKYEDMVFPKYVVDPATATVSAYGEARFTWLETSKSSTEEFTYLLEFDLENKMTRCEAWGDSAALYLASQGKLQD